MVKPNSNMFAASKTFHKKLNDMGTRLILQYSVKKLEGNTAEC